MRLMDGTLLYLSSGAWKRQAWLLRCQCEANRMLPIIGMHFTAEHRSSGSPLHIFYSRSNSHQPKIQVDYSLISRIHSPSLEYSPTPNPDLVQLPSITISPANRNDGNGANHLHPSEIKTNDRRKDKRYKHSKEAEPSISTRHRSDSPYLSRLSSPHLHTQNKDTQVLTPHHKPVLPRHNTNSCRLRQVRRRRSENVGASLNGENFLLLLLRCHRARGLRLHRRRRRDTRRSTRTRTGLRHSMIPCPPRRRRAALASLR